MNGPFAMDEDPNHAMRPLFPRRGLLFKRVPKAFLIVDYDAQLASPVPYGMLILSLAQTFYFFYYTSTHSSNEQGEVSPWVGVAGDKSLYLQPMGNWPGCEQLIWGDGEYWRLASYQFVHFGMNHIGFNMLAQLLFGTPIERVHGTYRIMLLYEMGVIGGALVGGWADPMKIVVGASGGVYTILGAHWANMAIAWDAMKNGTVPPFARMFVLASLMGIDLFQYFFYRAGGTSYAVHLGGWLIGFAGGILVLRELEVDFWETWVVRPLALAVFVGLVAYSAMWDSSHWPPEQPAWVTGIKFGDNTKQCCWKVLDCADYVAAQGSGNDAWGEEQFSEFKCNGYDLFTGDRDTDDDAFLNSCEAIYDHVYGR
jgi:rhomboid-related protein 1/2/3